MILFLDLGQLMSYLEYRILILPYTIAIFLTLLCYDYICTWDREARCIWGPSMSTGKLLLIINRYLPFVDTTLIFTGKSLSCFRSYLWGYFLLTTNPVLMHAHSPKMCSSLVNTATWLIFSGSAISELILMLRTYAIWQRNTMVFLILLSLILIVWPICIYLINRELRSYTYSQDPVDGRCVLVSTSNLLYIPFILLMVSETVIVVLTCIRAWKHLRKSRSGWVHRLYRDGIVFYFYILAMSILNVTLTLAGPVWYRNWLATPQRIVHSILCNRVLFFILDPQETRQHKGNDRRGVDADGNDVVHTTLLRQDPEGTRTFNINDEIHLEEMNRPNNTSTENVHWRITEYEPAFAHHHYLATKA